MSRTFILLALIFALVAVTFAAPFNGYRKLQQAQDDGLQIIDDDDGGADDDAGQADDDYFFGDDDLTLIKDDDDGHDDDDFVVTFPPNTSDYVDHSGVSIVAPAILVIALVSMLMF